MYSVSCTQQKNCGLLALIDEESRFPKGTDQTLATKLHHMHSGKAGNLYMAPPDGGMQFEIAHFAGHVRKTCNLYILVSVFFFAASIVPSVSYLHSYIPGFL